MRSAKTPAGPGSGGRGCQQSTIRLEEGVGEGLPIRRQYFGGIAGQNVHCGVKYSS